MIAAVSKMTLVTAVASGIVAILWSFRIVSWPLTALIDTVCIAIGVAAVSFRIGWNAAGRHHQQIAEAVLSNLVSHGRFLFDIDTDDKTPVKPRDN